MSIINLIKEQLSPELVSKTATQLGESESGVSKAIGGLLPAILGGFVNQSQNTNILNSISEANSSGILGNLLGNSSNNSIITNVLSSIFGDKVNSLINLISSHSGVSNTSAHSLLNLVTGATLGSIGKYATDHHLDNNGISNVLGEQKSLISSLLPAGLSLGALGLGDLFGTAKENLSATSEKVSHAHSGVRKETPKVAYSPSNHNNDEGGSFWKWLLPLILLGLASWFLWKQCEKKDASVAEVTDSKIVVQEPATNPYSDSISETTIKKTDTDIDLNGTKIKGFAGGMEDQLITFLKTDGYKNAANDTALKDKWYSFDKVNFKIGKSDQLEEGSQIQLDNLVAILKAYPEAKIKIGGYTDKTGNEAENVKLSQARADYIKAALTKSGVGAQVLSAEGYGSKFATVPAEATNNERATDRKMAIRFAK
jgi:outer membrane protein OmpA-like peptidoglycan-associated protein